MHASMSYFQKLSMHGLIILHGVVSEVTTSTVSSADMKKIHRLMSPREDGSFLVPEPIVKLWKDVANGGRDEVKKLWMTVGGDKDLNCNHGYMSFSSTHQHALFPELSSPWIFATLFQEQFVQKCKRRSESISEQDLWVDGAYMSEKAMQDEGFDA